MCPLRGVEREESEYAVSSSSSRERSSSFWSSSSWCSSTWTGWSSSCWFQDVRVLCRNPYILGMAAYGCGQCMPCRVNRRRQWAARIILESLLKEDNSFLTLTYSDGNVPLSGQLPSLRKKDLQDWLKRLRKRIEPTKVRYFGVGEYGDVSFRPHYHVALFGYPACRRGISHFRENGGVLTCCGSCDIIYQSWGLGQVVVGQLTQASAEYVAGYVTKKMTAKDDVRLEGREPEFARMSTVPGIGFDSLWDNADVLLRYGLDVSLPDVNRRLQFGMRKVPLGRYLTHKLRLLVGKEENAPEATLAEAHEKLRPMREVAEKVAAGAPAHVRQEIFRAAFADEIVKANQGGYNRLNSRVTIFKKRGSL